MDSTLQDYQQKYQEAGESLTREETMDEIVSDYTQMFLENTGMVRKFVAESEETQSWFRKIMD